MKAREGRLVPLLLILSVSVVSAQTGTGCVQSGHDATVRHAFDDVDHWKKVFDDPSRDKWQKPKDVVDFLRITAGQTVADIGAGTGYFTAHLARSVGREGKVYAVDVEPKLVDYVRERAVQAALPQIVPVLAVPADPGLPDATLDLAFFCDTWHHIDDRIRYLGVLARDLKPGGRVAVVDYREGDLPVGPPEGHKLSREQVVEEFEASGFRLVDEFRDLPYQYVLVFASAK